MMTMNEMEEAAIALVARWGEDVGFHDVTTALPDADPTEWDNIYAITRRVRHKDDQR